MKRPESSAKLTKHPFVVDDPSRYFNELAYLLGETAEAGNMRFIRHAMRLKLKIGKARPGETVMLTEKQISTLNFARNP